MKKHGQDDQIKKHGLVLWNYLIMGSDNEPTDFVIALGSHDLRTAVHAADLFMKGGHRFLIVTGGFGKVTKEIWGESEAEKFKEIALDCGVPENRIIVEGASTNTGDNFKFSKIICDDLGYSFKTGTIVTKPYMTRRAFAAACKQWPSIEWHVSPPDIAFEDYPNQEVSFERMMQLMVGDLQRIKIYAEKGFQIQQHIPSDVWKSYEFLVKRGFDEFVIRE